MLGHETMKLRAIFPPHWQQFVSAVSAIHLPEHVQQTDDRELRAAYAKASELYYGADGILERHRLKVAGYIEMGFKLGRNVTIGGFSGRFSDRTWREIDEQLVASRDDRFDKVPSHTHQARVLRTSSASEVEAARVRQVVLDTAGTGLNHAAGDRCLVLNRDLPCRGLAPRPVPGRSLLRRRCPRPGRLRGRWRSPWAGVGRRCR